MIKLNFLTRIILVLCLLGSTVQTSIAQTKCTTAQQLIDAIKNGKSTIQLKRGNTFSISSTLAVKATTKVIEAYGSGDRPKIIYTKGNNALFDLAAVHEGVRFSNLHMIGQGPSLSKVQFSNAAIRAKNNPNLEVQSCKIEKFFHGVFCRGGTNNIQGWKISNNHFYEFAGKGITINRIDDTSGSTLAGPLQIHDNTFERVTKHGLLRQRQENRAISGDGGNFGFTIFNWKGTTIKRNTFINTDIALSRIENVNITTSNTFETTRDMVKEFIHLEELCKNITISDNNMNTSKGTFNQAFVSMAGCRDITISNNTVEANSKASIFVKASKYTQNLAVTGNNLKNLSLLNDSKQVIKVGGCGGNKINIRNNTWKTGYNANVSLGTFEWDGFDNGNMIIPRTTIENLNRIEDEAVKANIRKNMYYRCKDGADCGNEKHGSFTGSSTTAQKVILKKVDPCGPERNFFGDYNRPGETAPDWLPTLRTIDESLEADSEEVAHLIYPNPVSENGKLHIQGSLSGNAKVEIFDHTGALVYTSDIATTNTIDISKLGKSGLYFVRVIDADEVVINNKLIVR